MASSKYLMCLAVVLLVVVLQTIPSSSQIAIYDSMPEFDEYFGWMHRKAWECLGYDHAVPWDMIPVKDYKLMTWIIRDMIIPTIRSKYGYNGTFTVFAPNDRAFLFSWGNTKLLQQVVMLRLDRETFKTLSINSTVPTFRFPDHIQVTQPLIDDANANVTGSTGELPRASLGDVTIDDWDLYNDGRIIVHGVSTFFDQVRKEREFAEANRRRNDEARWRECMLLKNKTNSW